MRILISGSKLYLVPSIQFKADLIECVVTAAILDHIRQEAHNETPDGNSSTNVEFLDRVLDCNGSPWIPAKDCLHKIIYEVEHDCEVAGHMGEDTMMVFIKRNFFWPGIDKHIKDFVCSCESCQRRKLPRHVRYGLHSPPELTYAPSQNSTRPL
jgi:hypothetical protein